MSVFSKISSIAKEQSSDSVGDDNIALSSKDSNPYISPVAFAARNAYDTLHNAMAPLIKGKKVAARNMDKWLDGWCNQLDKIREMYTELLSKIKDLSSDFTGTMTLDFAKEAWEIVQDTPILRRYMGEANYWYLYDTLGLLATQQGAMSGDMSSGVRAMVKSVLLGIISMTDGLISLETYLGTIQQYWGALYMKNIPLPLLDSIVPNVTTAYWYKPSVSTQMPSMSITNNPPGKGFVPIPMPIVAPDMAVKAPGYIGKFNRQDPTTWYYEGRPYYIPATMDLLQKALAYWGSSYTNEVIPVVNGIYPRRPYTPDGIPQERPLVTGKIFAQLDSNKYVINGTDVTPVSSSTPSSKSSVKERLEALFTKDMVEAMRGWQTCYTALRTALLKYIVDGFSAYKEEPSTIYRFFELQAAHPEIDYPKFDTWVRTHSADNQSALDTMLAYWKIMVGIYRTGKSFNSDNAAAQALFDEVMSLFTEAGHSLQGTGVSLNDSQIFAVAPSYAPDTMDGVSDDTNMYWGECFIAYSMNVESGKVSLIASGNEETLEGDSVVGAYDIDNVAFVMFPSDWIDSDVSMQRRMVMFSGVANHVYASIGGVEKGLKVGDSLIGVDGTVVGYVYSTGMTDTKPPVIGSLPDALGKHHSLGVLSVEPMVYANMFFPDGNVPKSMALDIPPMTFVDVYDSLFDSATDANDELSDVVGYSISRGREIKFPCFGIYGNLISMHSWHYKEMPFVKFHATYARVKSGSSIYYKKTDPSHVVFYHSSYMSQERSMQMAVYHEYIEKVVRSKGAEDSYTFYIFPTESISVYRISDSVSVSSLMPVDATAPDGKQYHYITLRNTVPKCAKYIDPENWSLMDIVHEMYLLAVNLSDLCGDNGDRLQRLKEDLEEFHITEPNFIGQLPENNGQYSLFKFGIFDDYAERIEKLVDSVYDLRRQLIAATNAL